MDAEIQRSLIASDSLSHTLRQMDESAPPRPVTRKGDPSLLLLSTPIVSSGAVIGQKAGWLDDGLSDSKSSSGSKPPIQVCCDHLGSAPDLSISPPHPGMVGIRRQS